MLHKTRARNARPYGHGGVMRSYFFLLHCRGAHRAPVIGICAKFRICSFPVKKIIYSFIRGKGYSPPSRGRIAFCLQSKESPAFPPGIPQLAHISKLGLNRKIKKFSDSFICGKGYSPPLRGENSFLSTVQSSSTKRGRAMRAPTGTAA